MMPNLSLTQLTACEDLPELARLLERCDDRGRLREELFALLLTVVEYRDAIEWARAVRICEAFAIVGWGCRERVDARSHFNGDCWDTVFITARGQHRYRSGRWRKRKAGWILFNPDYHFSPDRPDVPDRSWKEFAGVDFPVVPAEKLATQRNYQKQMPLVMGGFSGSNPVSREAFALARQLTEVLRDHLRPNEYGEGLDHFYLTLMCPGGGPPSPTGLKIGSYKPAQAAFYCTLTFPESFSDWSPLKQRQFFTQAIQTAMDTLEPKLRKKAQAYDVAGFRADLANALTQWNS